MIPLSIPNFEGNEEKYVIDAVSQGWVSTGGAYVEKLEQTMSNYLDSCGAVACQSGTAALHLALIESGVKANDLVIAPTLTFIAAINPITYVNAEPVFMDCDDSLCLDPEKLQHFCERECHMSDNHLMHTATGKNISAIIVVHVFGNLADMEAIMNIAEKYHLKVIEDATEALGSYFESGKYAGKMAGTIGDFGAYSFNGNKIITTGGGGVVISQDQSLIEHLRYLSTQAKDDPHFYIHKEIGYNYRMTNVQAAIGVAQMEELEEFISRKNKNYGRYCDLLNNSQKYFMLPFRKGCRSNKWFYSLVLNREICKKSISSYINQLEMSGIQTRPIWGLIHEQNPYKGAISYNIIVAKYYSDRIINLPCSSNLQEDDIQAVCNALEQL